MGVENLARELPQEQTDPAQILGGGMPCTAWFYETPTGEVQGPFSVTRMRAWHAFGYFLPSLNVRIDWYQEFYQLKDLFPRLPRAFEDPPAHPKAELDRLPFMAAENGVGNETSTFPAAGSASS